MVSSNDSKKGLLNKLSKVLHLHQLPKQKKEKEPLDAVVSVKNFKASKQVPAEKTSKPHSFIQKEFSSSKSSDDTIVTNYDKILSLVKEKKKIKLDEIARLLSMTEDKTAQELQTLEDNGLIEVQYPAFGEPLICVKEEES
jgi:hypothetical protein